MSKTLPVPRRQSPVSKATHTTKPTPEVPFDLLAAAQCLEGSETLDDVHAHLARALERARDLIEDARAAVPSCSASLDAYDSTPPVGVTVDSPLHDAIREQAWERMVQSYFLGLAVGYRLFAEGGAR